MFWCFCSFSVAEKDKAQLQTQLESLRNRMESEMQQPLIDIERERDELKLKVLNANWKKYLRRLALVISVCLFVCIEASRPSQQFFSHVGVE